MKVQDFCAEFDYDNPQKFIQGFLINNTIRSLSRILSACQEPRIISTLLSVYDVQNIRELLAELQGKARYCKKCGKKFYAYKAKLQYCSQKCAKTSEQWKDKVKSTMLQKYGVDNASKSPEIIQKIKDVKQQKYGNPNYNNREKFEQTMLSKYGYKNAQERFILHHEDYNADFIINNFVKDGKFLVHACKQYFGFHSHSTAFKVRQDLGIKEPCDYDKSTVEQYLFDWIPAENKIHNDRTVIKPYELDIFLPDNRLAIEYNGSYWHSTERRDKNYHLNKLKLCLNSNIVLYSIFDFDNLEIWKSMISNKLGMNRKIYARQCEIKELKYSEISEFLENNHLQGACKSKINIGLFFENELIQVMTFSKPRFNKKYQYELIRLCSKQYVSIIGGVSKLFKYFIQMYNPESIISYANRRFSCGKIYEILGFSKLGESGPNYWYSNGINVFSRVQCQKHKIRKLFSKFDENLTERENMLQNGYYQIFDCGNLVYTWDTRSVHK